MVFNIKRKIYESMPIGVKRSVCLLPFHWLAGRSYRKTFARGLRFESMSRSEILTYQERVLRDMLRFATEQVPAYRPFCGAVERFAPFDALKEFPLLTKEELQGRLHDYLPRDFAQIPHYEISTGGTSGNQLKFYVDDESQSVETAFVHRLWHRVGYTPRSRKATFRGVPFPNLRPGIFWQFNPIYNEIQFSPFHLSEQHLPAYLEQMRTFRPEYLHGYPSALDLVAGYILRYGLEATLPPIRATFLVSEGFTAAQRERIEQAFRTRVFSFYGHSERLVIGGECEKNSTYHHFPDYGIMEIIDGKGHSCCREGERGEIVGTGLLNRSMPLIRYRTGDFATRLESCCECGRHHDRFTDVKGRWKHEMLLGRNGAKISIAALNMHGTMFEKVVRYQYAQNNPGDCIIRVLVTSEFSDADRLVIEKAYQDKVGDELNVRVCVVDDIPLTARGKLKLLDSQLAGCELSHGHPSTLPGGGGC